MSDAWQAIKIRSFEHVQSGASTSLLRVSGKSPWRRAVSARPRLRVDRNGEAHRFAALPAPEDPRGALQAAYSIPTALIAAESKFWLEHADGALTELPAPGPGPGRSEAGLAGSPPAAAPSSAPPASHPDDDAVAPLEDERRSDLLGKLAEQSRALARAEREAAENEQARRSAEIELARTREARELLAAVEERAAAAEARCQELEQTVDQQRERIESLDRLVTSSEPKSAALERELTVLRSGRASLEQELDQSRDHLRIMTFERDELSRQAEAFDGVAVKARERATKAESENEQLKETVRELEVWRGELERRLAAITSELGVAKATHEADERELKRLREALVGAQARGDREPQGVDTSQTLAAQAAEIELLVAELASVRAQQNQPAASESHSEQVAARIARLEAEREELARRAEQLTAALQDALRPAQALVELARAGLDDGADHGAQTPGLQASEPEGTQAYVPGFRDGTTG